MLLRSLLPPFAATLICLLTSSLVSAHTVITYPGWRGDNLVPKNGTVEETNGLAVALDGNSTNLLHPYGLQWEYPCGGMPTSTNRTKWPLNGGAIAIQPGWFSGHATAFFYINMGFGAQPPNVSFPMLPVFQIIGPSRDPYPGTFCLPQVPLPNNTAGVKVGDLATIQVIETAVHGAALYNCVDIEFAEPEDVAEVNEQNCFNSTDLSFQLVFSTAALSAASSSFSLPSTRHLLALAPLLFVSLVGSPLG